MSRMGSIQSGYCAVFALVLAACGGATVDGESNVSGEAQELVVAGMTTGTVAGVPLTYRQRLPVASAGMTGVRVANGDLVDVARAAQISLSRHRKLEQELAAAGSALLAPADTTEEFIETEHTMLLVATTHMVVTDPGKLRTLSPTVGKFRMTGTAGLSLSSLTTKQRTAFADFQARMLKKPKSDPLGAAARQGSEALWAAVTAGKGDVTITTQVEVPIGGLVTQELGTYSAPALDNGRFDYTNMHSNAIPGFASTQPAFHEVLTGDDDEPGGVTTTSGTATTVSEFVDGFTQADAFVWKESWDVGVGKVTVEAGASYGFGLRIPIEVTGTFTPKTIEHRGGTADVESEATSTLRVNVIDADADFYEDAGLDDIDVQDGQEFVLNAEAHVTVKADILGVIDVDITLPHGLDADFGKDFRPPFDGCGTACGVDVWVPAAITKTVIDVGIAGANAQVGFNISGEGEVNLDYQTLDDEKVVKSTRGAADGQKTHRVSATDPDEMTFKTTLAPLSDPGEKSFGYQVSDVEYTWNLEVTPGIKGTVWVDAGFIDWDAEIGPFWLDFAKIDLGSITFGPHAGSLASQAVNKGKKSWSVLSMEQEENPGAGAALESGLHP